MTASELVAARTRLGLSLDQFASQLGIPRDWYVDFEEGKAKLPKRETQLVAFLVACAERDEALAKSGLATCPWIEQWEREAPPANAKPGARGDYLQRAGAHVKTCAACRAREQFVKERFPDMPKPPVAGWIRVLVGVAAWIEARPAWARPPLYGAVFFAGLTALYNVFTLLRAARQPKLLLTVGEAIVAAFVLGAIGGLVYSLIYRPVRQFFRPKVVANK